MKRHVDFERLQDYREGLLSREDGEAVAAHLQECPACREELHALDTLMQGLGGLPVEAHPSRDLWPQIEWRMGTEGASAGQDVGPEKVERKQRRQVTLHAWQLMAAGVVLAVISGSAVWAFLSGTSPVSGPLAPEMPQSYPAQPAGWEVALDEYRGAVADLEEVLEAGREVLDPETVRIMEENLRVIDEAIAESQAALAQAPNSKSLGRFLAENLRRKVDLLRRAAIAVYANT